MSYCRTGYDSDVYLFAGGTGIYCYPTASIWDTNNIPSAHYEPWSQGEVEARLNMLDKLSYYTDLGAKVPDSAIQRLIKEIEELLDA